MGLLDDAIREHLELKRLRGADPGVVAREEQDALGRLDRRQEDDRAGTSDGSEASPRDDETAFAETTSDRSVDSAVGQETVEINMEAEFAGETESGPEPAVNRTESAGPVAHPAHGRALTEESLEWEMPDDAAGSGTGGVAAEGTSADDDDAAEPVEDVLEETPDFLRDTPEQERLWFEQRPPRDFDFNE
ncbi:MAG TPA: hypothetical protein VK701_08595 [Solirubrobacteraceae bacterium]|jgi:hypothetical protein|nr:hypothetical protein [Solirubrobacteraceae bacterium]